MIIKQELLKIFRLPIVGILLLFFIIINGLFIWSHSYIKEELSVLTSLVDKYGTAINEEMLAQFGGDYQQISDWVSTIEDLNGKSGYEHPSDLLADDEFFLNPPISDKEFNQLLEYDLIETYYRTAQDIDGIYENVNVRARAEETIDLYGFQGEAAETVRAQFEKLADRKEQLIENGEHKHLFFYGKIYKMHNLLFKDIGMILIFELIILAVLITGAVTNYEFEQKTALVTYTTKIGRKLVIPKLFAAITANTAVIISLIGATLAIYFLVFNYSGLWHVPISSYFNAITDFPYITWWNISFIEYIGLMLLLIYLVMMLFSGMTYILSIWLKNTYLVFISFMVILGLGVLIPGYIPLSTNFSHYIHQTPFFMILNPHEWFMGYSPFTISPYYEVITISSWAVFVAGLIFVSIRRFYRQALH
ncbi:hypothetical protein F9U64_21825 [Gracilibacillus oryzae]|uniref:Uncharacterized protein n=1 Tax=Gracilibacillus oryzae TaxID=1672701 RepID=A0A7C8KW67_9BACI|nr:hypothetical protein [Gracilibacillus oryzae]KAB8125739.1 hypothetical protein F9U64_21825 [Gracilibacillus oryzae]